MYREYYGLKAKPFQKTPDPNFLYLSRADEEALERLRYAVEEKEIMLLTGDIGCGKTTLTRALIDSLDEKHRIVLVINPRLTPYQFLRVTAKRFDIDVDSEKISKDGLLEAIHGRISRDYEEGITPVIIIDEAQLIPWRETFEEIRLLTNYQLDDTNLMSLILVGQSEFRKKINLKALKPLRQRIGLFYHVGPLAPDELKNYVEFRLQKAGRPDLLFTRRALRAIHRYSGGLPRLINSIANLALMEGYGQGQALVDESQIEAASRELGLHRFN
jgi:type II secretory pathway predicted ATPase ExeA